MTRNDTKEVVATGNGQTATLELGPGVYFLEIVATTWAGASATLKQGVAVMSDADDPHNAGTAVVRTENGYALEGPGGVNYSLDVADYSSSGTTENLKLVATKIRD